MNKKLKRKQALIMAEPYRTPFNSKVAKVSGDVIEDSVGEIKYATSFDGATKIVDANKNLLSLPDIEETTQAGVTYSIKDGVITLNGTCTETIMTILISNNQWNKSDGYYYYITYAKSKDGTLCFIYNETQDKFAFSSEEGSLFNGWNKNDIVRLVLRFTKDTIYNNEIIKPMLIEGSTAPTEFEPNFKNLLEIGDLSERTKDGLTYYYKNGMIVVNGTSNGGYTHIYDNVLGAEYFEDGATYSFNDISNDNNLYLQFSLAKKDGTTQYLTKKNSFVWNSNIYSICYIAVQTAPTITTFNNIVIKPTFVKSSIIPTQFIPFANPYFVNLGQNGSVQYNGLEPREIDLKGNVISKINNQASDKLSNYALTKNTKVVDLGSLTWYVVRTSQANIIRYRSVSLRDEAVFPSSNDVNANILCVKYDTISGNSSYKNTKGVCLDNANNLIIYDPEYNTSDKLEAFKKAIRGTLLMYQVKNPTTINTTSFKTFKEDTNATISDDNFTSSPNAITENFKPTRSYDFKVNGFSNVVKSSNLFFLPDIANTTLLGLTYSAVNQKMTIKGTATQQYIQYYYKDMTDKMVVGKTYFLQCSIRNTSIILKANILKNDDTYVYYDSLSNARFTWISDFKSITIILQNVSAVGTTIDLSNVTFGLYETDNVAIPYEPYIEPYIESFADKKNLLKPPYIESSTKNGVSVANNNDGSFTFNGTATATSTFVIWGSQQLVRGTYYFSSNVTDNKVCLYNETANVYVWNSGYFVANGTDKYRVVFIIYQGVTVSNYITKPMLIKGKTAPSRFLPYQDKYSAFLNVKGKNLFDKSQIREGYYGGVVNTDSGNYDSNYQTISPNKTYYISGTIGNFHVLSVYDKQKNKISTLISNTTARTFTTPSNAYYYIYSSNTTNGGNVPDTIMISEGDTAPTEFEPYYSFTKEVLINQPLRKFDYLTYDGVYRQTNEIVLDGTNNIYVDNKGKIFLLKIPNADSVGKNWFVNVASEIMVTTSNLPLLPYYNISNDNQMGIGTNQGNIILRLDDSSDNSLNNWTVEKINNYFKQNPITITYKTVDQTFEATSLTRLLFKNGYNKITAFDSINNNAIVEYLEYYKSK